MIKDDAVCPCGSSVKFSLCCGCLLSAERIAATAEQLMRSRYTAFVLKDKVYLKKTWHPDTCPTRIELNDNTHWLELKIKSTQAGEVNDDTGTVEFVARFKIAGRGHRLHELSRFTRCNGQWCYVDGTYS
jgi:SEC-C motif-containing protein